MMIPLNNTKKRRTMIKSVVGKVMTTSYCLPEDGFVFGIANKKNEEGAGKGKYFNEYNFKPCKPMFCLL